MDEEKPWPPGAPLRAATYNMRVDHADDLGTVHDWPYRRALVASTIRSLSADIVALQAPSTRQIDDLEWDLGVAWGLYVDPCDPDASERAGQNGPSEGQARDGNGFAWRRARLQLLDSKTFWLAPQTHQPWQGAQPAWGGSKMQRTCVAARFMDHHTGQRIGVLSTRFDDKGDDRIDTGGSEARRQSAALVMAKAEELKAGGCEVVLVCGDFSTYEDRAGAAYSALLTAADGQFVDVRSAPTVLEADGGRGFATWEGWEDSPNCRAQVGDLRYDQVRPGDGGVVGGGRAARRTRRAPRVRQ